MGCRQRSELPAPPLLLLAPDRTSSASKDWGSAASAAGRRRLAPLLRWAGGWLELVREGFEAVRSAYLEVLDGGIAPNRAHVLKIS